MEGRKTEAFFLDADEVLTAESINPARPPTKSDTGKINFADV